MKRIAAACGAVVLTACGGAQTREAPVHVSDDAEELLTPFAVTMSIRPQALARDDVYGKLVSAALKAAAAKADDPNARRFLEVIASCDRANVGLTADRRGIAILEGVRADWEPSTLDSGNAWRKSEESSFEYRSILDPGVCLFVPKTRLWIVGFGDDACGRIHSRFVRPTAWSLARSIEGPLFEAHASSELFRRSGLQREFPGMTKTTLALLPGKEGVELRAAFDTSEHAESAAANARILTRALAKRSDDQADESGGLARLGVTSEWIAQLQMTHAGNEVTLRAALPANFAERFVRVK